MASGFTPLPSSGGEYEFPDFEGKNLDYFMGQIHTGMDPVELFKIQQELADFQLMVTMTTNFIKVYSDCNMAVARNMS